MFSFHPHQVGVFNTTQLIEILGPVSAEDPLEPSLCVLTPIHTIYIPLTGESKPVTKTVPLKYNPGITPLICNEVRICLKGGGLHDIWSHAISTAAISTVHNFNLSNFQPSAI